MEGGTRGGGLRRRAQGSVCVTTWQSSGFGGKTAALVWGWLGWGIFILGWAGYISTVSHDPDVHEP